MSPSFVEIGVGETTSFSVVASASGNLPLLYTINPALPTGLEFDSTTGQISGTATVTAPDTMYTITASHDLGSASGFVQLQVDQDAQFR